MRAHRPRRPAPARAYAATGLPIIVTVTELGVSRELMPEDIAGVLVAAGALTVLIFPFLARPPRA